MPKELRKGRYRISLDIPKQVHRDMMALAYHHNTTMTSLITAALANYIEDQKKYVTLYREIRNDEANSIAD